MYFFHFWLLVSPRKVLAFARKVMALPESGGTAPRPSGSYAYDHKLRDCECICCKLTL